MKRNKLIVFALMTLLIAGCGSEGKREADEEELGSASVDAPVDNVSKLKFQQLIADVSSPLEIMLTASKGKVGYNENLLRPLRNEFEFQSSTQKALNYGGYLTDVAYLSLFDQNQELIKYFVMSRKLAQNLNIGTSFDEATNSRFEKNLGNKDSLLKIINTAYKATNNYLLTNERLGTAAQMFTGSWIESIYLTVELAKNKERSKETDLLFKKIYNQKSNIPVLIALLQGFKSDIIIKYIIAELESLQKDFNAIKSIKDINPDSLSKISNKVLLIRSKIIAG